MCRLVLAAVAALLLVSPAVAQTAPVLPNGKEQEPVKLDPFNVSADADVGFVAASSLAGGRIATALKDTPVAYSVITKEFIDAFNVTDIVEAAQWSTNANQNEADGGTRMYGNSSATMVRTRGIKMGLPSTNYFTNPGTQDTYNVDRVDMARGPNSVLFGAGGVGGTMNALTKQPERVRTQSYQLRVGSFQRYRFTGDFNQPITTKLAVRLNVLLEDGGTWRHHEWNERRGWTLAVKYVVGPKLNFRTEVEYKKSRDGTISASMRDNISAWDGQTTISSYPANGAAPSQFTTAQLAAAGLKAGQPQRFVESADWNHVFLNFQNRYQTKGVQQSNTLANTNRIDGVPVITQGFNLNQQAMVDNEEGVPASRWNRALAGSPFFKRPEREDTSLWTNRSLPTARSGGMVYSFYATYVPFEDLYFEFAGNHSDTKQFGENTQRRGLLDWYLEVNRTLPNGEANPGFLKEYIDVFNYRTHRNYNISEARLQTVYRKNTRVGRLQVSVIGTAKRQRLEAIGQSMLLPLTSLAADARSWTDVSEFSEYGAYTRWYLNDGSPRVWRDNSNKPVTIYNTANGVTETVVPTFMYDTKRQENNYIGDQEFNALQAAGNFDLFKNRLVLVGAFRRDATNIYTKRVVFPGDSPAGWDGTTRHWKPDAPADYYTLTYQVKDATGKVVDPNPLPATSRPRGRPVGAGVNTNRENVGFPQYANNRFQDDYSAPQNRRGKNTYTYGVVVNVTKNIGLTWNQSTTFNLSLPAQRVDGSLVPPTASLGNDYGIRYTLPNNRLSVSVNRFTSYQEGATVRASGLGQYTTIANTPAIGDLTSTGRNIRGAKVLPQDVFSTITDASNGTEFELTANVLTNWRLIFNAATADAAQRDAQPDINIWLPAQLPLFRQILADAGVRIDAQNNAEIDPAFDDPTKINVTKVQAGVNAWNQLIDTVLPNLGKGPARKTGGSTKWTGNIATDYRFVRGPLRGLRVGGGANFRTGQVIGYHGSDTIRDPNNPAVAIPDPAYNKPDGTFNGANVPVYGGIYLKTVASASYSIRLKESNRKVVPKTMQFDLNIDNVLNNRDVTYANINDTVQTSVTTFRPRVGEDITSPARRTVPGNFGYVAPRNYTVSVKLNY